MRYSHAPLLASLLAVVVPFAGAAGTTGHTLHNSRLSITFGDTTVYDFPDADRVDAISWIDSAGNGIADYVATGGPLHCGDPQEFFGESYGEPEGTYPLMVFAGITDTWTGTSKVKGVATTSDVAACDTLASGVTQTTYALSTQAAEINELKITRKFQFDASTPIFSTHGLRAYVPRLPLAAYPNVLIPNAAGTAINTYQAGNCPLDCEETDWNGRWFADDDGAGNGVLVIRAKASKAPALVAINWDADSASALTSVVLIQPTAGWKKPVTEVEYLCFYDATSWPASARNAGKPPKGCLGT